MSYIADKMVEQESGVVARANIILKKNRKGRDDFWQMCCSSHAADQTKPALDPRLATPSQTFKLIRREREQHEIQLPSSEENFQVPFLIISQLLTL